MGLSSTPAVVNNSYSDPADAGPSTMVQPYYPVAALPKMSLAGANGALSDEKCPPGSTETTVPVMYEDLLVPYCQTCTKLGYDEHGNRVSSCRSCNSSVMFYMCSCCHIAIDNYETGVVHLNNFHNFYQKLNCPICYYETYYSQNMSNHMLSHDKTYNNSSSED